MEIKALTGVKIESESEGLVSAVFSTLNVIDKDGDVTRPGAFEKNAPVRISAYNHASWGPGMLPVGKGTIVERGDEAIMQGKFFMNTTHGRDTFETVKELGGLGEWSYGYDILEASFGQQDGRDVQFLDAVKVHEVSPVILGAGENTRTLAAKLAADAGFELVPKKEEDRPEEEKDRSKLKLAEQLELMAQDLQELKLNVAGRLALRAEDGRGLGEEVYKAFTQIEDEFTELRGFFAANEENRKAFLRAQELLGRANILSTQGVR